MFAFFLEMHHFLGHYLPMIHQYAQDFLLYYQYKMESL